MAIALECPVCAHPLEAPDHAAGKGYACPACHTVMPVPVQAAATPLRTFAKEIPVPPSQERAAPQAPAAAMRVMACPTCGKALTITPELENAFVTCPFCDREFRVGGHPSEHMPRARERRRRDFECPHCGSREPPTQTTNITQAGWVVFAVLLIFFLPLCWIGLLITERETRCYDCRRRIP